MTRGSKCCASRASQPLGCPLPSPGAARGDRSIHHVLPDGRYGGASAKRARRGEKRAALPEKTRMRGTRRAMAFAERQKA
jgi:hypothetical protein